MCKGDERRQVAPSMDGAQTTANIAVQRPTSPPPPKYHPKKVVNDELPVHEDLASIQECVTPLQIPSELIQQVSSFLSGIDSTGVMPIIPIYQLLGVQHIATVTLRINEASEMDVFPHPILDSAMIGSDHELLRQFLEMKTLVFLGCDMEDDFEFIRDFCERFHKMGMVEQNGVKFVKFQLQGDAKQWWRAYVQYRSSLLSPLTWTQFQSLYLEKYVPSILHDNIKDKLLTHEQGNMTITAYETKFHALSKFATQMLEIEEEWICPFVKCLNTNLNISALQMTSSNNTFNDMVDFVRKVEGVGQKHYAKKSRKKVLNSGNFSGSYCRGHSFQAYSAYLIQSALPVLTRDSLK